ncbi:CRISPR-associated exonuclease, Cas4 family [Algoriphagus ornithinivorans]|uniref:CRISPR-associated exonuclease Cas4 n=1 Tax=Algoriphagus ornithinivorans TaxID=226506 RepID=A0A1I5E4Y0_9BACT|nr:CRISPR-associated protein Cas4 [Algoriphagus ornithinivorans]SFO06477.1 CRISPR-associated exonuclease, Cas4 family [Algoriphagus ornithinivorans]
MLTNATLINLYHVCKRQTWLHANGIRMEHTSDIVAEGKLIGETSYQDRSAKYTELEIDGVKIDFYDPKTRTIHEVKKSDKVEIAHIAQVKYYLYILRKNGIEGPQAILEYPQLRQRESVFWEEGDAEKIQAWIREIHTLTGQDSCPPLEKKTICKNCSYYDFCYIEE